MIYLLPEHKDILARAAERKTLTAFTDETDETCLQLVVYGLMAIKGERQYALTSEGAKMTPKPETVLAQSSPVSRMAFTPNIPDVRPHVTLSDRQRDILAFIKRYTAQKGAPPSIREIGEATGIKSTAAVNYQLGKLEMLGHLTRDPRISRGLHLIERDGDATDEPLIVTDEMIAAYRAVKAHRDSPLPIDVDRYMADRVNAYHALFEAVGSVIDPEMGEG